MKKGLKSVLGTCLLVFGMSMVISTNVKAEKIMLEPRYEQEVLETYENTILTEGNYKYVVENGEAYIRGYLGGEENVVVPASIGGYPVKGVRFGVFSSDKTTIRSITLSEGIETVEPGWVWYLSTLESLHLPSTFRIDFEKCYENGMVLGLEFCGGLKTITIHKDNPELVFVDGILYSKDMKILLYCSKMCTKDKVIVPQGVIGIASESFKWTNTTSEVVLPDTVERIGRAAINNSIKINIPKNCRVIESSAFACAIIEKLNVSDRVIKIGEGAFNHIDTLTEITVESSNSMYCVKNKSLYSKVDDCLLQYPLGLKDETYWIPNGTKRIGAQAFAGSEYLKKVVMPESVKEIAIWAFSNSFHMQEVVFLGDAPKMEDNIFSGLKVIAYYPAGNATWTEEVKQAYGGENVVWKEWSDTCATPAKPYKIANVVSGVHVYWNAVDGASKYGLWRSENGKNGTYKWIANPTVPHFTDTKVETGKTYYYKVSCMIGSSTVHSEKSEPIGITYVSTPDIATRENKAAGIQLGWKKVEGATGYGIYRKSYEGNDAWVRVGTVEGNSTFTWTDTSVKNNNGTIYKYTIRALAGSDRKTLSGCRNAGRTMVRLSSQVLNSAAKETATSIKCSWTTSSRVTGYEVRFVVDGKVYKTFTVGNYKTGTKTFTGLKAGKIYKIQVRTYKKVDGVGSFYSAWSTAKNVEL